MCHGAADNFAGEVAARFFLGVFEASINPGTMLLFSMYYERHEQPLRMGIWIGSAGLGYVIAGIASFGIGHIQSSIASWRLLFIIWGSITTAWGIVLLFFLPGSPLTTKFLTERERTLAINRVKENGTGIENRAFKWDQFREAIMDLKTWLLFLFAVTSNSPNGGLTSVCSVYRMEVTVNILILSCLVPKSDYQGNGLLHASHDTHPNALRCCPVGDLSTSLVRKSPSYLHSTMPLILNFMA
jgi:MFS family permease